MAKLTCIELFAGAGGASLGLRNAGFKSMLAAEWDAHACETHRQGLPDVPVYEGDVREIDLNTIAKAPTLMWASPPCFPAGTPVVTSSGWKNIEDLTEGDLVLTHQGRYRKVEEVMSRPFAGSLVNLSLRYGRREIRCTPEHPFYARKKTRIWDNGRRAYTWEYSEPEWLPALELTEDHLLLEPSIRTSIAHTPTTYHVRRHGGRGRPAFIDDKGAWVPVQGVALEKQTHTGLVYNLEVEEDHSYVVFGVAAHNCQPFSSAGNRKGSADDRNGWPWTTNLIDEMEKLGKKPEWVICENVPGMVHHSKGCSRSADSMYECSGCYWENWIIPEFEKRYPHVSHAKLNSADYGVAQRRNRIFLVAGPVPFEWPEPSHSFENLVYEKWVSDEYWQRTGVQKPDKIHSKAERKLESSVALRFASGAPHEGRKAWVTIREALGLGYPVRHQSPSAPAIQHGPDAPSSTVSVKGTLYAEKDIQDNPAYNPFYDKKVIGGGTNPQGKKKEHERTFRDLTEEPSTTITCEDNYGNRGPWMVDVSTGAQSVSPDEPEPVAEENGPVDFFDFLEPEPKEKRKIGKWVVQHEDKEPGERPDLLDGTFRTVSATEYKGASSWGKVNRASDDLLRATGRKRLTVEECAVLQGFPEDWPFQGTSTARYRQVGNAVPPHVAEALARQVKKLTK